MRFFTFLRGERGFSTLELVVTSVLMVSIASAASLGFSDFRRMYRRDEAVKQLEFDIRRARAEASSLGARVVISPSEDGTSYTIGIDNVPYDENYEPQVDSIISTRTLPKGITMPGSMPVIFDSRGRSVDSYGYPMWGYLMLSQDNCGSGYIQITPMGSIDIEFYS